MVLQHPNRSEFEAAEARRAGFISAIPPELLDAEDKLPAQVRSLNAATRTKLHRIYQVAEDLSRSASPSLRARRAARPAAT
jgi:hypothetical protein